MIPFKSKYIFSLLLFITNNNRYFTYSKKKTVYILDIVMTYIYLWQNWLFIKEELIIHMLKSLTIFHQILKVLLAIFKRFHRILQHFFLLHTFSTLWRNTIPDDVCGRWLDFVSISIFIPNVIQFLFIFIC